MKTFGIITISFGRPNVLKLFCAGIKRLREDLQMFFPVVCVGDADHKSICDEYHVFHIYQENNPASRKWNTGVGYMMSLGVDYIVIMGSDDIMSTNLLKNLMTAMERGYDIIGINQIYFYGGNGRHKGVLRLYPQHTNEKNIFGVARTISMEIVKKAHPMWTRDRNWAMDGDCMRNIKPYLKNYKIVEGECFDVKTQETQLNRITYWLTKTQVNLPQEVLFNCISEEEKQILLSL